MWPLQNVWQRSKGHGDIVNSVAWSPNGKLLASGSIDKTIILWDIASGKRIRILNGHNDSVTSVIFASDDLLISGSNTIKLWNVASGINLATLIGHNEGINSVAISPDGKTLASGEQ